MDIRSLYFWQRMGGSRSFEQKRILIEKRELDAIIRAAARGHPQCEGCMFGLVYSKPAPAGECNWGVELTSGKNSDTCHAAMASLILFLQDQYFVDSPPEPQPQI